MNTPLKLLVVEDSEDDAALLVRELTRGGFEVSFTCVDSEPAFRQALGLQTWNLIISDYSMPHFSGTDALRIVRERELETPFIFVSGTIGEETAVAALKEGAQDYIMKGNLKRLVAAAQRELREFAAQQERKRLELQVHQLQRFEAIGRLAGGIAHDFNNVLGAILGWTELGANELPANHPTRRRFEKIRVQTERAAGLTRQLLAFARRQLIVRRNIDLNENIAEGISLLQKVIGEQIEIGLDLASDLLPVCADASQVEQVLMNLCLNARDAMPQGGKLTIETRNMEITERDVQLKEFARPGSYVLLCVSDTGVGMNTALLEHIFEPFYTTKETGKGTGLGLATVYGIVKQHGGCILVESEVGKGSRFRVYLPAGKGPVERQIKGQQIETRKGSEMILVAEDNEAVREAEREILETLGYRVLVASNGDEALRIFEQQPDAIDLVFLDIIMPGLTGTQAYRRMKAIRPDIRVIFATGYVSEPDLSDLAVREGLTVLQKPYDPKLLGLKVRAILDQPPELA